MLITGNIYFLRSGSLLLKWRLWAICHRLPWRKSPRLQLVTPISWHRRKFKVKLLVPPCCRCVIQIRKSFFSFFFRSTDPTRGELKGTTEREKTDRLRERRKKKATQRVRQKERERVEKAVDKANPGLGNKHARAHVLHSLQKAEKEGTVSVVSFQIHYQLFSFLFSCGDRKATEL